MRSKVLIVDDMEINRDILSEILEDKFDVIEADNGKDALDLIEEHKDELAVVLLDLMMPVMNGYEVLEVLSTRHYMARLPVLVISGEAQGEKQCLDLGVADFIHKPFDETIVTCRVNNVIDLYAYKNSLEDKVKEQTDTLRRQNLQLMEQAKRLEETNSKIIDLLGTVVESRDLESGDHIKRVKGYTGILAAQIARDYPEYGLSERDVDVMMQASVLHDVGKIAIPDSILLKPGRFTPEEFEIMKEHTTRGSELLENIEDVWDEEYKKMCCEICRWHHERYDGKGYPDKLSGEEIPISAQIVSIADVYDALVSKRVYKDPYQLGEAFEMIVRGECGTFSPKILACLEKVRQQFEEMTVSLSENK